jgi:hypothetical protein
VTEWTKEELERHIDDCIEEQLQLEYKAAASLGKQNDRTNEITKDVSAMANSDGGTIIYGIKQRPSPDKHLPERIDPIDRTQFSKEWLEDIVHLIRPRIDKLTITPVDLGGTSVCYVIEVPTSTTAHQAKDHRYYKRHNFKAEPMEDYEVRLVMNRATAPNVTVRFENRRVKSIGQTHYYTLHPMIKNEGTQVIHNIKVVLVSPPSFINETEIVGNHAAGSLRRDSEKNYIVNLQSVNPLFPEEEREFAHDTLWQYSVVKEHLVYLAQRQVPENDATIQWRLYADNMRPKTGTISYYDFQY